MDRKMKLLKIPILGGISTTLDEAAKKIRDANLEKNDHLQFFIDNDSTSLSDLYSQARILSCLFYLQSLNYNVSFQFKQKKRRKGDRISGLKSSGFIHCLKDKGIQIESNVSLHSPEPRTLFPIGQKETNVYSYSILPFMRFDFKPEVNITEETALEKTHSILNEISIISNKLLKEKNIQPSNVSLEFGHILWGILKEFILNSIVHSGSDHVYIGMRIQRETGQDVRSHRPGSKLHPGIHVWDICLFDTGLGILPTADAALRTALDKKHYSSQYFQFYPWISPSSVRKSGIKNKDDFSGFNTFRFREEMFLKSIFQGNLGIRKGRRSEGLYEIGKQLHWFDGVLGLRSGRSGTIILSAHKSDAHHIETERQNKLYPFLPGVIVSAILPSTQLASEKIRLGTQNLLTPQDLNAGTPYTRCRPIEFIRMNRLPAWLFGSQTEVQNRRAGEILGQRLVSEYFEKKAIRDKKRKESNGKSPQNGVDFVCTFLEINLRHSTGIRAEFLDVVLQELCKASSEYPISNVDILPKLIFTNVRRDLIKNLLSSNCNSFFLIRQQYCLFYDEADQPHFLGIPRISQRANDLEDAMNVLLQRRVVSDLDLIKIFKFDVEQIEYLKVLVGGDPENIFFFVKEKGITWFHAHDVLKKIRQERMERLWDFTKMVRHESGGVVRLMNGQYVDKVVDFPWYWTQKERLIDAAKVLLLEKMANPPVHCVIGFMHIGDRLAGVLQHFLKASDLCILDPKMWTSINEKTQEEINLLTKDSSPDQASSILVVDAVYPGDDKSGYLYNFLHYISKRKRPPIIHAIVALADFRNDKKVTPKFNFIENVPLYTVFSAREGLIKSVSGEYFEAPKTIEPKCDNSIRALSGDGAILDMLPGNDIEKFTKTQSSEIVDTFNRYSDIELSSEFWHNSSMMKLISPYMKGREKRNMIFYENNEQIIAHYRTRSHLDAYLSEFIQKKIKMRIDVILHPTHTVGSFLAHLVASKLSNSPLILPLKQNKYGGEIRITPEQFEQFQQSVSSFGCKIRRKTPRALIVDDSVITGSSLFTMVGVAKKLDLETTGVFVVLNKLSPAISAAIATMPFDFSYLYRLHMPLIPDNENPDTRLKSNALDLLEKTSSFLVRYWCNNLLSTQDYLRPCEYVEKEGDRFSDVQFRSFGKESTILRRHELTHIIDGLLLHTDESILDFDTKVAITYNFLEDLCRERVFWELLHSFIDYAFEKEKKMITVSFTRQIILLIVFTRHGHSSFVRKELAALCKKIINQLLVKCKWSVFGDLLCDAFLILYILEDPFLFTLAHKLIKQLGQYILVQDKSQDSSESKAAWKILSAYAWSIESLVKFGKIQPSRQFYSGIMTASLIDLSPELRILYFELFPHLIITENKLRDRFGIRTLSSREKIFHFVQNENELDPLDPVVRYLNEAPGYSCTLALVIEACDASGVFIFAKRKEETEYQLRTCASKIKPAGTWNISATFGNRLNNKIQQRMLKDGDLDKRLFFISSDKEDLTPFHDIKLRTEWIMGGSLYAFNSAEDYYVILTYDRKPSGDEFPLTDYYYWRRISISLQTIIPEIHEKHAISARASSAAQVAVDTLDHSDYLWSLPIKKRIATFAVILMRAIEIPKYGLDISQQTPVKIKLIKEKLELIADKLRIQVKKATGMLIGDGDNHPIIYQENRWIEVHDSRVQENMDSNHYISFNGMVFQFILLESLRNALVNYEGDMGYDEGNNISDRIHIRWKVDISEKDNSFIHLWVENSCDKICALRSGGKGVHACKDAAKVIGGKFEAMQDPDKNSWVSHFYLPVYIIPYALEDKLEKHLAESP